MPNEKEKSVAFECGANDRIRFENAHPGIRKAFDHPPYPASPELARLWRKGWDATDSERETHYTPKNWSDT